MDKKKTGGLFVWIILLVVLIGGSIFLYQRFSPAQAAEETAAATSTPSMTPVQSSAPAENTGGGIGSPSVPDFTVEDADGNEVALSSFAGQPIVMNFWASWCPYCVEELPEFQSAYEEYGDDVVFLIIDLADGSRETVSKGKDYIAEYGYTFPVYFDTDFSAAYAYSISSIPLTVFIDAEGNLSSKHLGAVTASELQSGLEKILP
jgi:thiol-disulfide isomerase/thioredoxin